MTQKKHTRQLIGFLMLTGLLAACATTPAGPTVAPTSNNATTPAPAVSTPTTVSASTETPSAAELDPDYWLSRQNPVGWLGWTPDGKTLAVAANSGVYLFDLQGNPSHRILADDRFYFPAALDPQGKRLIAGDHVWDVATGQLLYQVTSTNISSVAFSPDGTRLALREDNSISVWDALTGKIQKSLVIGTENIQYVHGVAFRADGQAVYAIFDHKVRQVDLSSWKITDLFRLPDDSCCTAFSSDAQIALVSRPHGGMGTKELWDMEKGSLTKDLGNCENDTTLQVFSQDGSHFVIGPCGGAQLWDTQTGQMLQLIENPPIPNFHPDWRSAAFSPDGTKIALGNDLGQIMIWDLSSYALLQTLTLPLPATPAAD